MEIEEPSLKKKGGWTPTNLFILALSIGLPASLGLGVVIGANVFKGPHTAAAAAVPSAAKSAAPAMSASAAPTPVTLTERATSGDYKALDELKGKSAKDRTAEETLALARGRSGNKGRALEGLGKEIQKNPALLQDKAQVQRLKDFLNDRETTNQAATLLVQAPGEIGADLLFDAATHSKANPETVQLAEDLLASKEVRSKASPALLIALDLGNATECEQFKTLLPTAAEKGDRRAVPSLIKLTNKRGCGDNKLRDCYECLRPLDRDKKAPNLGAALREAGKRVPPKF